MSVSPDHLPEVLKKNRQLAAEEAFQFGCHPGVACFNSCCGDVNILLTPLDVLRLARRTGLATRDFLDRHTLTPITKDLHLPVVMLRMTDDEQRHCPFVGEHGCTVYHDRPWACRMYPLGMALPPARAGVDPEPIYFLFEDEFCKGRSEPTQWTAARWRMDQGVLEHDAIEAGFREIVSHPWFIGGRQLDAKRMEMFHTACYDLDRFREFVFASTFLQRFELSEDEVAALRDDDLSLLRFAFRWLRYALFGEPTMTVRAGAPTPRRSR
jgi:uncharacterized protein